MKKTIFGVIFIFVVMGSFLAGSWYKERSSPPDSSSRRILYYVDPMNPSHTSDKPGLAPCGMKLEPVYADESGGAQSSGPSASMPPGTVRISPERQQLIGVRIGIVERSPASFVVRTLGKVAPDERRIYRLNTSAQGWVRQVFNSTSGSIVMKDEPLASFYTNNFVTAQQAYFFALGSHDRFRATGDEESEGQTEIIENTIRQAEFNLINLGVGRTQLKELEKTRKYVDDILVSSPVTGFVLARNVTMGQQFDAATELFRIADLSRVWVLADIYDNEAPYIHPDLIARVSLPRQGRTFEAVVSDVLPLFDSNSRTLKVRIEVDNPEFALRPDMLVDVDFSVAIPPAITVPAEAVLDSGVKKTVFVDRGNGYFEPRKVETGQRLGSQVEIIGGLMPGEKIVVSGNFLIDSESRMQLASAGMTGQLSQDPVCGMQVEESKAGASGMKMELDSKTYFFCSEECKKAFEKDPEMHARKISADHMTSSSSMQPKAQPDRFEYIDLVCGMPVAPSKAKAEGRVSDYKEKTYSFCSKQCKEDFDKAPDRFLEGPAGIRVMNDRSNTPDHSSMPGHTNLAEHPEKRDSSNMPGYPNMSGQTHMNERMEPTGTSGSGGHAK